MNSSRLSKFVGILQRLAIWVLILSAWEVSYRIIQWAPWRFPAPSHVIDSMLSMVNVQTAFGERLHAGWPRPTDETRTSGGLLWACLVSAVRLLVGFALSVGIGGLLGLAMWRSKRFDDFLGAFLLGLQTLPSVCWVPLGIVVFGLNESGVMFVLVMGSFSAIAISLRDGLRTMPPLYRRAGLMLGARGWKLYRYVLLPASLPAFATSLRQGFSFAWRSLLGAELIFSVQHHGLGFLLQSARDVGGPADVIAVMVVMILIGMFADRFIFAKVQQSINSRFGLG